MSYTPIAEYVSSKGVSRFKTTCPTLSEAVEAINSRSNVIYSWIVLPDGSKVNLANQNGTWMLPEGFEELSVNSDGASHSDGSRLNGAAEAEPADATAGEL